MKNTKAKVKKINKIKKEIQKIQTAMTQGVLVNHNNLTYLTDPLGVPQRTQEDHVLAELKKYESYEEIFKTFNPLTQQILNSSKFNPYKDLNSNILAFGEDINKLVEDYL